MSLLISVQPRLQGNLVGEPVGVAEFGNEWAEQIWWEISSDCGSVSCGMVISVHVGEELMRTLDLIHLLQFGAL